MIKGKVLHICWRNISTPDQFSSLKNSWENRMKMYKTAIIAMEAPLQQNITG
jgi:hypothetical protein